jgi:hypothetical protein
MYQLPVEIPEVCCVQLAPEFVDTQTDPEVSAAAITVPESLMATVYQYLTPAAGMVDQVVPESTDLNRYEYPAAATNIDPSALD